MNTELPDSLIRQIDSLDPLYSEGEAELDMNEVAMHRMIQRDRMEHRAGWYSLAFVLAILAACLGAVWAVEQVWRAQ